MVYFYKSDDKTKYRFMNIFSFFDISIFFIMNASAFITSRTNSRHEDKHDKITANTDSDLSYNDASPLSKRVTISVLVTKYI